MYEFRTWTSRTIALVKYHMEVEAYIREGISACPESVSAASGRVSGRTSGASHLLNGARSHSFLVAKGMNAAVASKLTGYGLVLVDEADLGRQFLA